MSYKARAQERASNLQDQEMHSYYQPWLAAHGSATNVASNVDSIAAADLQESGYRARSSQDRALTAFAQLATLRLNVRRAMVSLIDSKYQYILTEATRTVSLISADTHEDDDELWLGNTVLNREDAVCHNCMNNTYMAKDREGTPVEVRGFVVPDCREHEDLKDFSYVQAEPGVRFYAGVPIITRSGHAIGVYAVSDESPREEGLSLQDMRFMQDIATAVLEHLEWARDRVDRFKGERIVRGLANFIECCASTSNAMAASPSNRNSVEYSYEDDTTGSNDSQDDPAARSHRTGGRSSPYMPSRRQMTGEMDSDAESVMSVRSNHSTRAFQRERQQDASEDYVEKLLRRAARILRKATLADGAVFFGTLAEHDGSHGLLSPVDERSELDAHMPTDERGSAPLCQLLGASIGRNIDRKTVSKPSLSVKALHQYFKAYPEGKTLNFSNKGLGLSSEEDSSSEGQKKHDSNSSRRKSQADINEADSRQESGSRRRKGRISHAELLENLPGVRTLIFIPLRDAVTGKYFAGGFLWTSTANRMMDLTAGFSYLKAFGNSISSEIARANAEKLDRAKATFIASMSHELRSPLHGILGSVEFLQDTMTDSYQAGLITSISDCSRTLLDTLSNLLSYAKVSTMESVTAAKDNIDLAQVVEEVVEAVCAGHTFKKLHTTTLAQDAEGSSMAKVLHDAARHSVGKLHSGDIQDAATESSEEGTVCVLLDFQPSVSWNVSTNPGAVRRIVMNLVGNALKYTTNGFVAVSVRAKQVDDKLEAIIRVVDSGKGIGEDFQRNHLYMPFKQEDTFASGTGLGLSIVKQLVDSLGGSIRLLSTVGQGTEIELRFTFESSTEDDSIDLPEKSMVATAARTKDLRVCVLDPNDEKERPESNHIARLDKTLSETCSAWFGMEITEADNMTEANTDMFLYTEPPSLEYLLEHHGDNGKNHLTPLIIVCMNATEAIAVSQNQIKRLGELGSVVEVVPQPCGPMKLAKILNHVLDRVEQAKKNNENIGMGTGNRHGDKVQQLGNDQVQVSQDLGLQINPYGRIAENEGKKNALLDKVRTQSIPLSTATAPPGQKADHETRNSAPPMSPRTLSTQSVEQAPEDSTGTAELPSLHLLLVDDNKINVNLLVKFARKFNLTCEEAYNGLEAVAKFKQAHSVQRPFDCILMDISMPVMDGIEATRAIREYEEDNHLERTRVIALSAFTSADTQQEAKSNGVDVYLAKPVKFGQLKKLLLDK